MTHLSIRPDSNVKVVVVQALERNQKESNQSIALGGLSFGL